LQEHPDNPEAEKEAVPAVLEPPWRSHAYFLAQNQAQIKRRDVNQQPLQDIPMPSQVRSPHSSRVVDMRKASFHSLAPPPQQLFASLAPEAPPIGIHGGLLARFSLPVTVFPLRLAARV
jgi:hypothetical protein